jgi:hypothetical protein
MGAGFVLSVADRLDSRVDCVELKTPAAAAGVGQQPGIPHAPGWQQSHVFAFSDSTGFTCTIAAQKKASRSHVRRFMLCVKVTVRR